MKYSYLYGAQGASVRYSIDTYKDKTRFVLTTLVSCIAIFGLIATQLIQVKSPTAKAFANTPETSQTAPVEPTETASEVKTPQIKNEPPTIKSVDVSAWLLSHKGTYSVTIYDQEGNSLLEANANNQYFMASIYKLYTAYVGYQKIDSGQWRLDEPNYVRDWTRGKCLDEMIRSSDSPCGERMMAEIGKSNIQDKLNEYGLENTSFGSFTTSSADVANVLVRLQKGLDLSAQSRQLLMDSMLGQKYREGMPAGFADWSVYDKVGFREQDEYHDVGLVTGPDGKTYIISIMTIKAGPTNIASLAQAIKTELTK